MTDEMNFDNWDLAEILVEREQPTESVTIYLSEVLSFAKANLEEAAASAKGVALKKIETEIAEIDKQLEAKKYIFHLTGVPGRMREDIGSKGLAEFPRKMSDFFTDENQADRAKYETILIWVTQIVGITNPNGKTRSAFTEDDIQSIFTAMPDGVKNAVNVAINTLQQKSNNYVVASKSADF